MAGIDTITARILEEAESRAEAVRQEKDARVSAILQEAERSKQEIDKHWSERIESEGRERYRRLLAMGELERRKTVLTAKQSTLDILYQNVLDNLCSLDGTEWNTLVMGMILGSCEGGESLLAAAGQRDRCAGLLPIVNSSLESVGKRSLSLADSEGSFKGGCMLIAGGVRINLTFEALTLALRQDTETDSAQALFT